MESKEWDEVLKKLLDFSSIKSDLSEITMEMKLLNTRLGEMEKNLSALMEKINKQSEHPQTVRATGEQAYHRANIPSVPQKHVQTNTTNTGIPNMGGRCREMMSLFINEGFFTYQKLAERLGLSQSRTRAYVSELKKFHNIPIAVIKDSEGVKVGLSTELVNEIIKR